MSVKGTKLWLYYMLELRSVVSLHDLDKRDVICWVCFYALTV